MALTPRYRGGQTAPEPARLAGAFRRRSPGLPSRPGRRQSVKLLATLIEMYGAAPEFAQQNPCHSASDGGPNGGRTCPRHPVAQHLDRDKHNECDYGGDSSKAHFFPYTLKHRALKPSEIRALDFKGEFRRSAICSVSATIGINRSIPDVSTGAHLFARMSKYRRSLSVVSLFAIDLGGRCTTQS